MSTVADAWVPEGDIDSYPRRWNPHPEPPMHPPVDPWGSPTEPTSPLPMYGRAAVPPAAEQTEFEPMPRRRWRAVDFRELGRRAMSGRAERDRLDRPRPPMPHVSWQRSGVASRRMLFDGWGFTATGLVVLFCGWGVWAAAGGAGRAVPPLIDLLVVVAVGAIVFAVLRLASRVVIEGMWGRRRPHARWAHFITGLFLTVVGVSYLLHNAWLGEGVAWLRDLWQRR